MPVKRNVSDNLAIVLGNPSSERIRRSQKSPKVNCPKVNWTSSRITIEITDDRGHSDAGVQIIIGSGPHYHPRTFSHGVTGVGVTIQSTHWALDPLNHYTADTAPFAAHACVCGDAPRSTVPHSPTPPIVTWLVVDAVTDGWPTRLVTSATDVWYCRSPSKSKRPSPHQIRHSWDSAPWEDKGRQSPLFFADSPGGAEQDLGEGPPFIRPGTGCHPHHERPR